MKDWSAKEKTQEGYLKVCEQAVNDDKVFATFKSDKRYTPILEHVSYGLGQKHLDHIRKTKLDFIYKHLKLFFTNDRIGSPNTNFYYGIGEISPTTLRYIDVTANIVNLIGSDVLSKNIVEIGGGYGGQCVVIHQLYRPSSYTMFDLPIVEVLQEKYCEAFGIHLKRNQDENIPIDLVISNYAWSELSDELRKQYIDGVICKANHGYFTLNAGSKAKLDKMIKELDNAIGEHNSIELYPDVDDKRPLNKIVVW